MLNLTQSAFVILGTGTLVLSLAIMLFVMCVRHYNLIQKTRKAYIDLYDHRLLVRKYDDIMRLYMDKERSLNMILRDYSFLLRTEGVMDSPITADNMAIQSDLSDKILGIYEEIVHSRIPAEELTN